MLLFLVARVKHLIAALPSQRLLSGFLPYPSWRRRHTESWCLGVKCVVEPSHGTQNLRKE